MNTDSNHRRTAMNIAAQLPADPDDRRAVVAYFKALLPFLDAETDEPPKIAAR